MAGQKIEPVAGEWGTHPAARQSEGRARPIAVTLLQQGQIEQPLAWIIEKLHRQLGGAAEEPKQTRRGEPQHQPHASQIGRARGPVRRVGGERRDRLLERERRHFVGFRREQPRTHNPPLRRSPQERQTPRPAGGTQQILNQTGNKGGLAGPAEPGNG